MTSTLSKMYKQLTMCVESLDDDVRFNLKRLDEADINQNVLALEETRNFHYQEILKQLQEIKKHIKVIDEHNQQLMALQNITSPIDKNYIKKQVEAFQNIGDVPRREKKLVRIRQTSSMKFLECWEKMMDEQKAQDAATSLPVVKKRLAGVRNTNKRLISSTVDLLETSDEEDSVDLQPIVEETGLAEKDFQIKQGSSRAEADELHPKPRIVDVMFKTQHA